MPIDLPDDDGFDGSLDEATITRTPVETYPAVQHVTVFEQVSIPTPAGPGASLTEFVSPAASRLSNSTYLSETYARLDQVELLNYRALIDHCKHFLSTSVSHLQ